MKGIYFCEGLNLKKHNVLGIENKVYNQINSLKRFSEVILLDIQLNNWSSFEKIKFFLPVIKSKREKEREKLYGAINDSIQYIYIRKPSLTIEFYKILKHIKRDYPNIYIIMEIPTYPFHSEYHGLSKFMTLKSIRCEKKLKEVVDIILTYSDDKEIWGIKTLNASNCVNYKDILPRTEKYRVEKNTIRMTCVANFVYWHGIDRLINGINEYKGSYKIVLNLVGQGQEIEKLRQLAQNNKNIIFHGPKSGKQLSEIFDKTDIAVDALGRHRSGVTYNSSLKGKEYAARGIPSISAVKTELDYFKNFKYYLRIPADETYVNIEDIIVFYNKIYNNRKEIEITKEIRNLTEKKFDYKYGFEERIYTLLNSKGVNNERKY